MRTQKENRVICARASMAYGFGHGSNLFMMPYEYEVQYNLCA